MVLARASSAKRLRWRRDGTARRAAQITAFNDKACDPKERYLWYGDSNGAKFSEILEKARPTPGALIRLIRAPLGP